MLNSKHEVEKTGTGKSTERVSPSIEQSGASLTDLQSENKYSSRRSDPQQDTVPVSTGSNPFVDVSMSRATQLTMTVLPRQRHRSEGETRFRRWRERDDGPNG